MGKKIGGATTITILLLLASNEAWAQAKQPAPPPEEKQAEIKRKPFKPGPLMLFKAPSAEGMATDKDARQENKELYRSAEDDEALAYLLKLYNESSNTAEATMNLGLMKRIQLLTQSNRLWGAAIPLLEKTDQVGYEAVVRCMGQGINVDAQGQILVSGGGVDVSPDSPRIDQVCFKAYQEDVKAGRVTFVSHFVGLSATSIAEQVFTGTTLTYVRLCVGDAKINTVAAESGGNTLVVELDGSGRSPLGDQIETMKNGYDTNGDGTPDAGIVPKLGSDCEKSPGNPFVWDSANFPKLGIDVPAIVYKEVYKEGTLCPQFQGYLAAEAVKRRAEFVSAQMGLAEMNVSLNPLVREQLQYWRQNLDGRLVTWFASDERSGRSLAALIESIVEGRRARHALLRSAVINSPHLRKQ